MRAVLTLPVGAIANCGCRKTFRSLTRVSAGASRLARFRNRRRRRGEGQSWRSASRSSTFRARCSRCWRALVGLHGVRELLSPEAADRMIISLAFIPARYSGALANIPGGELAAATSFLTHIFVHADLTHLLINAAWLLAFGSILSRRLGATRFFAVLGLGGIAGAVAFLSLHWGEPVPVVGASGAIAALMGAVLRFLFVALDRRQGYLLRENPSGHPGNDSLASFDGSSGRRRVRAFHRHQPSGDRRLRRAWLVKRHRLGSPCRRLPFRTSRVRRVRCCIAQCSGRCERFRMSACLPN